MIKTIKKIDVCYSNASVIVTPVQNDAGSRFLAVVLTVEGERFDLPTSCTVQLAVRKPDSTETLTAAVIEDNMVIAELTNQTLAVKGIADAQIVINSGENVLKTPPFKLNIYEQIVSDDTVESTDEFSALSKLLNNYQQVITASQNKLDKSGDTMSGNIDMNGHSVKNVPDPQENGDAANKKYVDERTSDLGQLIYSATLEEEVRTISLTQDMLGNDLNLSEIYATFFIPASASLLSFAYIGTKLHLVGDFEQTQFYNRTTIAGGTEGKYHIAMLSAKINNNRWEFTTGVRLNAVTTTAAYMVDGLADNMGYVRNLKKFTNENLRADGITFTPTGTDRLFPAGMVIEVYGK